ncbi:MAG TPA: hypothetical protein VMV79_03320, partial [Alphaproteobacteria bacterium]|nr:hypothetical protein [Alphaproteobacteria bacterium]
REVAYFKNKVDSRGRTLSDGLQRLSGIFQDVKEVPILRTIGAAIGAVALGAQYVAHRTWTVMRREAKGYSKFELH